jgi:hypothetical protein
MFEKQREREKNREWQLNFEPEEVWED